MVAMKEEKTENLETRIEEIERFKELKRGDAIEEFTCSLYDRLEESNPRYHFSRSIIPALSSIISKTKIGELDKKRKKERAVIFEADLYYKLKPSAKTDGRRKITVYEIRLFDKLYHVLKRKGHLKEELEVRVAIRREKIFFNYENKTKMFQNPEYDFIYSSNISNLIFRNSEGVAIKKTYNHGILRFGGNRYNFGVKNQNKHIILIFSKNNVYFFDLFGRILYPISKC